MHTRKAHFKIDYSITKLHCTRVVFILSAEHLKNQTNDYFQSQSRFKQFPKNRNIFKTIDNKYLFGLSITFKSKIITKLTNIYLIRQNCTLQEAI